MKRSKLVLGAFLGTLTLLVGIGVQPQTGTIASAHAMAPSLAAGPQAVPAADTSSTNYGLFTCQTGKSSATCYDPYQMRHAYGVDSLISQGFNGTGKTIAIVDAFSDPYLAGDLAYFDNFYGLPTPNFVNYYPGGEANTAFNVGWSEEMTLDVEWAHAIAPGAKIVLVHAATNNDSDINTAIKYAVDNKLGDVISMSFGENENCMNPTDLANQHQIFTDATRKGITLFASSGDQGAAQQTCDGNSWTQVASSPASDPLVTAVGGTELHAAGYGATGNPAPGTYQGEVAWNESGSESGGGGFSQIYNKPAYQQGVLPTGNSRSVPDISYNAAVEHGVLVRLFGAIGGGWYLFGGTSAGSPQMAAITAIADQKAGRDLGFLNTALYHMGQNAFYGGSLNDVTSGTNSVVESDASNNPVAVQGWNAGTGWDAATGLGTPKAGAVVDDLIHFVSPGDATAVLANTKAHTTASASARGHVQSH